MTGWQKLPATRRKSKSVRDRRFARTQDELLCAFRELVLSHGYEHVSVSDIAERANVGRSTFYEHYESKDDLFRQSLRGIVPVLADAVCREYDRERLDFVVRHFWERRGALPALVGGAARALVIRYLAEEIEGRLAARRQTKRNPLLPLPLVAAQIAEAQCGFLQAWAASGGVTAEGAAQALAASSQAIAAANGA